MPIEFLRFDQLETELGVTYSHSRLKQLERMGRFPKSRKLGPRKKVWLRSEVLAWISAALGA
jgi:predicted DNA-binding transcriptional regulator AlpA